MTPEDILAELRDIHLPDGGGDAVPTGLAPEPFALLALILCGLVTLRWLRRGRWRRGVRARLRLLDGVLDREARWRSMIALLQETAPRARGVLPPEAVFRPANRATDADVAMLRDHLKALLRT